MSLRTAEVVVGECPKCKNHINDWTDGTSIQCNKCKEWWSFKRYYKFFKNHTEYKTPTIKTSDKKPTPRFKD